MMASSTSSGSSASSTTYWMTGLSSTGSISLGVHLVPGRKRVPRPAAGMIAFMLFKDPFAGAEAPRACGTAAADQIAIPKHLTAGTICRYKAETILQQVNANYCSNGAILLPNGRAPDTTQITEHGSLSNRCRGAKNKKDGARNANPVCKEIWRESLIT